MRQTKGQTLTRRQAIKRVGAVTLGTVVWSWSNISQPRVLQKDRIAIIVTDKGHKIRAMKDLKGLKICASTLSRQYWEYFEREGASLLGVRSSDMTEAYQKSLCDAMIFVGVDREYLRKGVEILLGGSDRFETYYVELSNAK